MAAKKCTRCLLELAVELFDWNGRGARTSRCHLCRLAVARNSKVGTRQYQERRAEPFFMARYMLGAVRARAVKKKLICDLDLVWFREALSRNCSFTGLPFELVAHSPWYPSVDRIDSTKGYTKDNCRLVVAMYNYMKNRWTDGDCIRLACVIAARA